MNKKYILRDKKLIKFLFQKKNIYYNKHLLMYVSNNDLDYFRSTIFISKKIAKKSVARNYVRRQIKSILNLQKFNIPKVDIIIIVKKSYLDLTFLDKQYWLIKLLKKIKVNYNVFTL